MFSLARSLYFELVHDESRRVVRWIRSATRMDVAQMNQAMAPLPQAVAHLDRAGMGLIVDVRLAPARNDPEFERTMRDHLDALAQGFRRRAVLVRSAAGVLQVSRLDRNRLENSDVFRDEAEALAFLS
jgi:hypothetical protein